MFARIAGTEKLADFAPRSITAMLQSLSKTKESYRERIPASSFSAAGVIAPSLFACSTIDCIAAYRAPICSMMPAYVIAEFSLTGGVCSSAPVSFDGVETGICPTTFAPVFELSSARVYIKCPFVKFRERSSEMPDHS